MKGKGQGMLPVTILSHAARQGPAVPKITPENNNPSDGDTWQLAGAISRLWAIPWQGDSGPGRRTHKGISRVKRLCWKSLGAKEPVPAACMS